YLSGATSIGRAARTAATPSGLASTVEAGRATYRGLVGWATGRGNFQLSGSVEQNGAGTGLLPRQYIVGLQADRVSLRPGGTVLLNAAVQRYGWFGDRPGANLVRLGLTTPLGLGLFLTADVERNPFVVDVGGASRWIAAFKVERGVQVSLAALRPAAQGVVYEDRNANGHRDPDEPGVLGAVVRRGAIWTAQVDSVGLATFHALPPGRYKLDIDLTGLSEPLQPRGPMPGFTVEIGGTAPRLKVPVYPRRIRMRDGSRPGRPGSGLSGSIP